MITRSYFLLIIIGLLFSVFMSSCKETRQKNERNKRKHLTEKMYQQGQVIYVDKVDPNMILQNGGSTNDNNIFNCFKVGFVDSNMSRIKESGKWERYFQYDMQKDWFALVNGDTIPTVYFQTFPTKNPFLFEGILVFEILQGQRSDTLIYKNSFSTNNAELFVLNR